MKNVVFKKYSYTHMVRSFSHVLLVFLASPLIYSYGFIPYQKFHSLSHVEPLCYVGFLGVFGGLYLCNVQLKCYLLRITPDGLLTHNLFGKRCYIPWNAIVRILFSSRKNDLPYSGTLSITAHQGEETTRLAVILETYANAEDILHAILNNIPPQADWDAELRDYHHGNYQVVPRKKKNRE